MDSKQIAENFTGQIPQTYTELQINSLTSEELSQFDLVLGTPDLTKSQLIEILMHLNAIELPEQIFAYWNDNEIVLYSFDPKSTPKSRLILSTYDQLWKTDKQNDEYQAAEFLSAILSLTVNYESSKQFTDFEKFIETELELIANLLNEPITRLELGNWKAVESPYNNIRIGYTSN